MNHPDERPATLVATTCARCVRFIGRVRVEGRKGGVFCSERCADESDYERGTPAAALSAPASAPPVGEELTCPNCGRGESNARFAGKKVCDHCGAALTSQVAPQPVTFTVCDDCWSRHYGASPSAAPVAEELSNRALALATEARIAGQPGIAGALVALSADVGRLTTRAAPQEGEPVWWRWRWQWDGEWGTWHHGPMKPTATR